MTIKKSDRDMLVRRDAEGREEFVAWGKGHGRMSMGTLRFEMDGNLFVSDLNHDTFTVIPRDRIEVTDDVADLGPGWRVRYIDRRGNLAEAVTWQESERHNPPAVGDEFVTSLRMHSRLLSAWRILPETPSEVEALADEIDRWEGLTGGWDMWSLAEHLHELGYRKTQEAK